MTKKGLVQFIQDKMSRTIITNSGSWFFTNINAEQMLGELCKEVGAKYFPHSHMPSLAYSMTKKESDFAASQLRKLVEDNEKLNKLYTYCSNQFLGKNTTLEEFKQEILQFANDFEKSEGYICEG